MSWLFSQALVAAYSEGSSSDGKPFVLSKLMGTQRGLLRHDKTTDAFRLSQFGTTSRRSTGGPGGALLTWFREDFLVRTSQRQETEPESTANDQASGRSLRESFARWDRSTLSWRTPQCSLLEGLDVYSETWPQWGIMQNGACSVLTTPARLTGESESGFEQNWPTPRRADADRGGRGDLIQAVRGNPNDHYKTWPTPRNNTGPSKDRRHLSLDGAVRLWPTPTVFGNNNRKGLSQKSGDGLATFVLKYPTPRAQSSGGGGKGLDGGTGSREMLEKNHGHEAMKELTGGMLNPTWVEWLMGWPLGWTDCTASATDKFRQWQHSHGAP